jgi:branched-chain amino acid transport system permease protein
MLDTYLQIFVSGLAMGAIYTLTAKGLFIAHLATNKVNFGQGDFLMVAAFLSMALLVSDVPLILAAPLVLGAMALLGWGLERIAIRPLARQGAKGVGAYSWILTTAGVALILQNIAELVWGKSSQYSPPLFSEGRDNVVDIGGVSLFVEEILVILVSTAVVLAFYWMLFRSRWGRAIYTVAFNPEAAMLLGINVRRTVVIVFVMAALLAGISGILVGPLITIHPHIGLMFTIKALAVATIGGFANPLGVLIGGVFFGVAEAFSNYVDSAFGDLYPLVFILIFLVVKPDGLFGEGRADVR